jgi:hypothetical protein
VGLQRADSQILGKHYGRENESMNASVADPYHLDAKPDPAFHIETGADPDPFPRFQVVAKNLEKVLK